MIEPPVTLTATCVLGIAYAGLSVAVGRQRGQAKCEPRIRIRAQHCDRGRVQGAATARRHTQFAEYVPISVVLSLVLELNHANRVMLAGLAAMLVVSRTCMAIGLGRTTPNPLRTAGNLLQWGMISIASAAGLLLATGLNQ